MQKNMSTDDDIEEYFVGSNCEICEKSFTISEEGYPQCLENHDEFFKKMEEWVKKNFTSEWYIKTMKESREKNS